MLRLREAPFTGFGSLSEDSLRDSATRAGEYTVSVDEFHHGVFAFSSL
jgi:hypothetical protein